MLTIAPLSLGACRNFNTFLAFALSLYFFCLYLFLLGSGPEGADDLCFHICRNFSFSSSSSYVRPYPPQLRGPNSSPEAQILAVRPIVNPRDPNSTLEAQILALRPKFQPRGPKSSPEAQIQAQILASRPKF